MALPIMFLTPAVIGLLILYVYPLLWEFNVSFTKMSIRYFVDPGFLGLNTTKGSIFVGLQNYIDVFTKPVLPQTSFYQLFAQTIIWTAVNVFFHVVLGVLLALMLNRKLRGRTVLSGAHHPALGHPGGRLAPDLAHRVQLPVRRREPDPGRVRHRAPSRGCPTRPGTSWP